MRGNRRASCFDESRSTAVVLEVERLDAQFDASHEAAHDEDSVAVVDEPLCSREPDTAAAGGDRGDLATRAIS
jgi:hypothetical protein